MLTNTTTTSTRTSTPCTTCCQNHMMELRRLTSLRWVPARSDFPRFSAPGEAWHCTGASSGDPFWASAAVALGAPS